VITERHSRVTLADKLNESRQGLSPGNIVFFFFPDLGRLTALLNSVATAAASNFGFGFREILLRLP
jgi:hypothetical protein